MIMVYTERELRTGSFLAEMQRKEKTKLYEDEMKIQRIVFLAQIYGIRLQYNFIRDFRGVFSRGLRDDLIRTHDKKINYHLADTDLNQNQVMEFKKQLTPFFGDDRWLDTASTMTYIRRQHYPMIKVESVFQFLLDDYEYSCRPFRREYFHDVFTTLKKMEIVR